MLTEINGNNVSSLDLSKLNVLTGENDTVKAAIILATKINNSVYHCVSAEGVQQIKPENLSEEVKNWFSQMMPASSISDRTISILRALTILSEIADSKTDEILVLVHPEVYLHPSAQSFLGKLLAETAARGVQVVLDTHSDHIINAIRIAVKNKIILPDDVRLYCISALTIDSPVINEDGRLSYWPEGFLDEWDKAIADLV